MGRVSCGKTQKREQDNEDSSTYSPGKVDFCPRLNNIIILSYVNKTLWENYTAYKTVIE